MFVYDLRLWEDSSVIFFLPGKVEGLLLLGLGESPVGSRSLKGGKKP